MKTCVSCSKNKPLAEFGKHSRNKDGKRSSCKICTNSYYIQNRERLLEKQKKYAENNKDKIAEYKKQYREYNRISIKKKFKKYSEKINARRREFYKTEEGNAAIKNINQCRRSITKQGDVTTKQLLTLQQNAKVCYWCGISLKKAKVHVDHYEPLSKGGLHTLSNLVISCSSCNLSKKDKSPFKFAQNLGKLL